MFIFSYFFFRFDWSDNALDQPSCRTQGIRNADGIDLFICFTISSKSLHKDVSSLSALMYLNDFHELRVPFYVPLHNPNIRASRGARILIHEPGSLPDISKGFDVSPGQDVKIELNMEVIRRLDKPYDECTNREYLDNVDTLPEVESKYQYSTDAAVSRCQQHHTINTCNCVHPFLPINPEAYWEHIFRRDIVSCFAYLGHNRSLTDMEEKIRCLETISFDKACKEFLAPCKETVYSYEVYQTAWPHEIYEMAFYDSIINASNDARTDKFRDRFSVYDSIGSVLEQNRSEGLRQLRQEDLIERNFIQLTAKFQVCFCNV